MNCKTKATVRTAGLMAALMAAMASCTSSSTPFDHGDRSPGIPKAAPAQGASAPVVTGTCPQISLREGTAVLRKGGKGKKGAPDDNSTLSYQASLADTTRQCTQNEMGKTVHVMAQGRIVLGPMGKPGTFTLPIRVAVIDGDKTVYSQLVKTQATLNPGETAGQFLFQKDDVLLPPGTGDLARVFMGFDEGPYNTK